MACAVDQSFGSPVNLRVNDMLTVVSMSNNTVFGDSM